MTAASSAPHQKTMTSSACPASSSPTKSRICCGSATADQLRKQRGQSPPAAGDPAPVTTHQTLTSLRKELNALVAAWHHRSGQPHGVIHADLRRTCGGPAVPQATAVQITSRIDAIRRWSAS